MILIFWHIVNAHFEFKLVLKPFIFSVIPCDQLDIFGKTTVCVWMHAVYLLDAFLSTVHNESVSVCREDNRSAEDQQTYEQWIKTMEPIYNNTHSITRVRFYSIFYQLQCLTLVHHTYPNSFVFFQRQTVVSDSQVIHVMSL